MFCNFYPLFDRLLICGLIVLDEPVVEALVVVALLQLVARVSSRCGIKTTPLD